MNNAPGGGASKGLYNPPTNNRDIGHLNQPRSFSEKTKITEQSLGTGSSGHEECRRWGVHEMGNSGDGCSGVKLLGSNPGSLLRSKSTRRERRCESSV